MPIPKSLNVLLFSIFVIWLSVQTCKANDQEETRLESASYRGEKVTRGVILVQCIVVSGILVPPMSYVQRPYFCLLHSLRIDIHTYKSCVSLGMKVVIVEAVGFNAAMD